MKIPDNMKIPAIVLGLQISLLIGAAMVFTLLGPT